MTSPHPMAKKCTAHNRRGAQCGEWAQPGQSVCHMHGGRSPQALASAELRMRDLVHPALSSLQRLIEKDEFSATKYVLDWAGFRPASDSQSVPDSAVTVTVIFDHANQDATLSLPDAAAD